MICDVVTDQHGYNNKKQLKYTCNQQQMNIILFLNTTAAGLAQPLEHLTAEWEVTGSIPGAGPIIRALK